MGMYALSIIIDVLVVVAVVVVVVKEEGEEEEEEEMGLRSTSLIIRSILEIPSFVENDLSTWALSRGEILARLRLF